MTTKLDMARRRLDKVVAEQAKYRLPVFLIKLRKSLGLSRKEVAKDLGIDYQNLSRFELGYGRKPPEQELLKSLAEYYGISKEILEQKTKDYLFEMYTYL